MDRDRRIQFGQGLIRVIGFVVWTPFVRVVRIAGPVPCLRELRNGRSEIDARGQKSREQFEIRTHKRLLDIMEPTPRLWTP